MFAQQTRADLAQLAAPLTGAHDRPRDGDAGFQTGQRDGYRPRNTSRVGGGILRVAQVENRGSGAGVKHSGERSGGDEVASQVASSE